MNGGPLTLWGVSLARLGFGGLLDGATSGGFDAVSLWDHTYRRAIEREGLTLADLGPMLADRGLTCTHVEALFDWLSPPLPDTFMISTIHGQDELMEVARAVGAHGLVAAHFGDPVPTEQAAEAFAAACDRAAEQGLHLALEYPAWATIGTFAEARQVVEMADRVNGGLLIDTWHHVRCGADLGDLVSLDPSQILGIQLADGASEQVGTLQEDAARRCLPGTGEFGLGSWLETMSPTGLACPVGPEIIDVELNAEGASHAGAALGKACRALGRSR